MHTNGSGKQSAPQGASFGPWPCRRHRLSGDSRSPANPSLGFNRSQRTLGGQPAVINAQAGRARAWRSPSPHPRQSS
eukprot:698616-Heterocapsa_arctica.AAC.1